MKIDRARWLKVKGKTRLFWSLTLGEGQFNFQIITGIRSRRMSFHVSTWTPEEI